MSEREPDTRGIWIARLVRCGERALAAADGLSAR
jgi:hypothetical protein